jgi:hypothetical protein
MRLLKHTGNYKQPDNGKKLWALWTMKCTLCVQGLPAHIIFPPPLSIRFLSSLLFGVWSSDNAIAARRKTRYFTNNETWKMIIYMSWAQWPYGAFWQAR